MEQQDFLKRQIDKFGEVLAKLLGDVLGLESLGKVSEFIELVDKTMKSELNTDLIELTTIPNKHFIEKLTKVVGENSGNLSKLADILLIVAKAQQDKTSKNKLIEQVIEIDKYLETNYKTLSFDRYLKITEIKNEISV